VETVRTNSSKARNMAEAVWQSTSPQCAKTVFDTWSQSVPTRTRKWARLFSKLDFEEYRKSNSFTQGADAAVAGPGVARLFGASDARELRRVLQDFMKDLAVEERAELRFVLHAEAIRRGLGTYSITARKKNF